MKRLLIALILILSAVPAYALDATSAVGRLLLWPHGGTAYTLNCPFTTTGTPTCNNADIIGGASATCGDASACTKGAWTVVDTGAGSVSLSGTTVSFTGTGAFDTTGIYDGAQTRANVPALFATVNTSTGTDIRIGYATGAAITTATQTQAYGFATTSTLVNAWDGTAARTIGTYSNSTDYPIAIIPAGFDSNGVPFKVGDTIGSYLYGSRLFRKISGSWTYEYGLTAGNTATIYPTVNKSSATASTVDLVKVPSASVNTAIFQPYALDTFTGSNGDNLVSGHTMDVGSGWTSRVGDSVWRIDTNTGELGTAGTNPANNPTLRYIQLSTVADGIYTAKIKCDITSSQYNTILFRGSAETANGMNLIYFGLYGTGTACGLSSAKYVNGTATALFTDASAGLVNGTYYTFTVQTIGNTIRLYVDGVKKGSDITESFNNTATWFGTLVTTTALTDKTFDNFSVHGATTNGNGTSYSSFFSRFGY